MYLRNIDFSGGTFINVKFNKADLTGAQFNKTIFIEVDLAGAILYPLNNFKETKYKKPVTIISGNHYKLVKQYSDLMKNSQKDQAQCLNKLFTPLQLVLFNSNLKGFNLIDINLEKPQLSNVHLQGADLTNANFKNTQLHNAKLQKAILSKKVMVPNYSKNNHTELFNSWCYGDTEHQQSYQKLVNAQFNITLGVNHKTLIEGLKKKKDLRNADLLRINLQKADLTNANLKNAGLRNANLSEADLTKTNLQGADLRNANLQNTKLQKTNLIAAKLEGAQLSYRFRLPKNCKDEDLLEIYKSCKDQRVKPIFKQILEAKKIPIE